MKINAKIKNLGLVSNNNAKVETVNYLIIENSKKINIFTDTKYTVQFEYCDIGSVSNLTGYLGINDIMKFVL